MEEELIIICQNIRESFNFVLHKIDEESKRIDSIEKKVRLLEYKASCKLLEFNDIRYLEMDDIEKIICLSADLFSEIYNCDFSKENIYMIKSILLDFNIDINKNIRIIDLYQKLIEKPEFIEKLFISLNNINDINIPEHIIPILSGANKIKKLNNEESYILSALKNINNTNHNINDIKINLIIEYGKKILDFDYNSKINNYEIIIMIINELKMIANQNNDSIKNISLEGNIKIMNKYYSSKDYLKAITEADNILEKEKNNLKAHNIKIESVYKLLINETKNYNKNKKENYKDIAKIYLIKEDYDNAFKYLNKYLDNNSNDKNIKNIIKLKKKLKEQHDKIKKDKEKKLKTNNKKENFNKNDKKIILLKEIKEIKETNKNKKEYLDFINIFWDLYFSNI